MSDIIKIFLADDEELFRKGIYFLLNREKNIEILFEASNGKELIDQLNATDIENLPDIIMMDLKMPEIKGGEAKKKIVKDSPKLKILF